MMIFSKIKFVQLAFLAIFALSFFLFSPSLNYYFFQDDWFVLNWARTGNLASFLSFRTDIIYWRPLSMPLLFGLAQKFFDLNPFQFHLLAFGIFFALVLAIYKLFLLISNDRKIALIITFLYALWPIHFISLSWFSTTSYIIGPLFEVCSFIFFLKFIKKQQTIFLLGSFIFFLLGMSSSEFTLVIPLIFLAWGLFFKKKTYLKFLLPYFLVDAVFVYVRFFIFPIPAIGDYQPHFNLQILNNLIWYLGWTMGLPESFKYLIFPSMPAQSIKVITQFWTITIPVFLLTLLLLKLIFENLKKYFQSYFFGFFWLILGLMPVIAITNHAFPMYLSFGGLGFLYLVAQALAKSKIIPVILAAILWIIISFNNLEFTRATHWVRNVQAVSGAYIEYTKNLVSTPPAGSIFLFKPADAEFAKNNKFTLVEGEDTLHFALNGDDAIQVIYADSSLRSFYATHQQKVSLPATIPVFEISPQAD